MEFAFNTKNLSILKSRHHYNEYEDILSIFERGKLIEITNSEYCSRILYAHDVKNINGMHLKKMAFDRSYAISMPQWR